MTEKDLSSLRHSNLEVLIGIARKVNITTKTVHLQDGSCHSYDRLCICTGAVPKVRQALSRSSKSGSTHQACMLHDRVLHHELQQYKVIDSRVMAHYGWQASTSTGSPNPSISSLIKSTEAVANIWIGVQAVADSPHVLVLRDRDTVDSLAQRLQHARRVAVVGNGGIAMELVFSLRGVEVR